MFCSYKKSFFLKSIFVSCFVLFIFLVAGKVQAANLYFNPASGNYNVGDVIKVAILVDTQNAAINSVDSSISFPKDFLNVISVDKVGSIFTFWAQEPTFSNITGEISLSGGLPTPGYNGPNGRVANVSFRVVKSGLAPISFASGAVLANDGLGTNVLQNRSPANFTLDQNSEVIIPTVTEPIPVAPVVTSVSSIISSPTHPDSSKWYSDQNPKFVWPVTDDVTAIKISYTKYSDSIPTVSYAPVISEKQLTNVPDGRYYFNLQLKTRNGWGPVSHFGFNIDTTKPSGFSITEIPRQDTTFPQVKFTFNAKDNLSGIDHFDVQIDQGKSQIWVDDGTHNYQTATLDPGQHLLMVKAYDKAGNFINNSSTFTIDPLKTPTISDYPRELSAADTLIVRGLTYQSSQVLVYLQKDKENSKTFTVQSNQNGEFIFTPDSSLVDGVYTLWAQALDSRGAKSLVTDKVTILVTKSPFVKLGISTINILSVAVPLVGLIALFVLIMLYVWHKFLVLRKCIQREARNIEKDIHKAFDDLKDDMLSQVKMLKKAKTERDLTAEEEKIVKRLRKNIDVAENLIQKEIETLEKDAE